MPHEPAKFEGDWYLLIEEQPLERTLDMTWTLSAGRIIRRGEDAGSFEVVDDTLILAITATLDGALDTYRFDLPPDQIPLPGFRVPAINSLSGYVDDIEIPSYCTLLRENDQLDRLGVSDERMKELGLQKLIKPRHDPVPARTCA